MKSYRFKINGNEYNVEINSISGAHASVTVNGTSYQVEMETAMAVAVAAAPVSATSVVEAPLPSGPSKAVTSPLPGVIISLNVNIGDKVSAGQEVAVLEAMKMENSIEAVSAGTVTAIHVAKGDSVLEGAPIVTIS